MFTKPVLDNTAGADGAVVLNEKEGLGFRKHRSPNRWEENLLKDFYIFVIGKPEGPTSFNSQTPRACILQNNPMVFRRLLLLVVTSSGSHLLNDSTAFDTKIYIYKNN